MKPITDEALALLGVSNAMAKITVQLEHLGLAASKATHDLLNVGDVGQKLTHRGFMLETIFGHSGQPSAIMELLGATASGRGGGGGGWGGGGRGGGGGGGGGGYGGGGGWSGPGSSRQFSQVVGPRGLQEDVGGWFGKKTALDSEKSPEVAANFWTQKLLRHGNIDPKLIPKVAAHLSGGRPISDPNELLELQEQMRRPSASFHEDFEALKFDALQRKAKNAGKALNKKTGSFDTTGISLEQHEIDALNRFDKDRITEKHRDQLFDLMELGDVRREDSNKRMPKLAEGLGVLNSGAGYDRWGREHSATEALQKAERFHSGLLNPTAEEDATLKKAQDDYQKSMGLAKSAHERQRALAGDPQHERNKRLAQTAMKGDKATAGFTDSVGKADDAVSKFAERLGAASERFMKKGILGMASAAEAASPDAFSTLTGSWKLLLASMGEGLLPVTIAASMGLQNLAKKVQGLDSSVKTTVGVIAAGVVGIAGAGTLLRASGIVSLLGMIPRGAALAVGGMALKATGIGAVAAAAGAGLGYLAQRSDFVARHGQFFEGNPLNWFGNITQKVTAPLAYESRQRLSVQETLQQRGHADLEEYRLGYDPAKERLTYAYRSIARAAPGAARQREFDSWQDWALQGMGDSAENVIEARRWGRTTKANEEELNYKWYSRLVWRLQSQIGPELGIPGMRAAGSRMEEGPRLTEEKAKSLYPAQRLLLDLQSRVQPGYFSPEDIHKKVQIEALSESPLQQEIRQIQLKQLDALLLLTQEGRKTREELRQPGGLLNTNN